MNKYDKLRKVFRTLKTGVLFFNSNEYNNFNFCGDDDTIKFKVSFAFKFHSKNGNNIDWYIKKRIQETMNKTNQKTIYNI